MRRVVVHMDPGQRRRERDGVRQEPCFPRSYSQIRNAFGALVDEHPDAASSAKFGCRAARAVEVEVVATAELEAGLFMVKKKTRDCEASAYASLPPHFSTYCISICRSCSKELGTTEVQMWMSQAHLVQKSCRHPCLDQD